MQRLRMVLGSKGTHAILELLVSWQPGSGVQEQDFRSLQQKEQDWDLMLPP